MGNRQELEHILEKQTNYKISKEVVFDPPKSAKQPESFVDDQKYGIEVHETSQDIEIDYVLQSKNDPSKKIFLMYKDQLPAMVSDVLKLDYLKKNYFPQNKHNEYVIFCSFTDDPANEKSARSSGIHYYKEFHNLKEGLKKILA